LSELFSFLFEFCVCEAQDVMRQKRNRRVESADPRCPGVGGGGGASVGASREREKRVREVLREKAKKSHIPLLSLSLVPFSLFYALRETSCRHALSTEERKRPISSHCLEHKKRKRNDMTKKRPTGGGIGGNGSVNEHCPEKVRFLVSFFR